MGAFFFFFFAGNGWGMFVGNYASVIYDSIESNSTHSTQLIVVSSTYVTDTVCILIYDRDIHQPRLMAVNVLNILLAGHFVTNFLYLGQ